MKNENFNSPKNTLKAFLQAFKIALKNALIYPHHHPGFLESIKSLHHRLSLLLSFKPEVAIKIGPSFLQVEEILLDDEPIYRDLARYLHLRQLKTLIIKEGVTPDELIQMIKILGLPLNEYYHQGGFTIFRAEGSPAHIKIEELVYSQLLTGEGEEIKDIWAYLLHKSLEKEDSHLFKQVEESFTKFLQSINLEKLIEDEEFVQILTKFFSRLKVTNAPTYPVRVKEFCQSLLRRSHLTSGFPLEKFKQFLDDLNEEDLASLMVEELLQPEDFDAIRWQLLTRIIPEEKNEKISKLLKDIIFKQSTFLNDEKLHARIRHLSSLPNYPLAETYKSVLEEISLKQEASKTVPFEFQELTKNYRAILLNLLYVEQNQDNRQKITEALIKEIESALDDKDFEFILLLYPYLQNNRGQLPQEEANQIKKTIIKKVEQAILEGEKNIYFQKLINLFDTSYYNDNVYLETLFEKKIVTPYLLQAFLHFFSEHLFYFFLNLDKAVEDISFAENIINNLALIDSPHTSTILKHMFSQVSPSLQVKILQIFRQLQLHDNHFIFPLLKSKNYLIRKEAAQVLLQQPELRDKVLRQLLLSPSPFGLMNKKLRRNIKMLGEIRFTEARPYLEQLAHKKFFWNKKLREEARQALTKIKS